APHTIAALRRALTVPAPAHPSRDSERLRAVCQRLGPSSLARESRSLGLDYEIAEDGAVARCDETHMRDKASVDEPRDVGAAGRGHADLRNHHPCADVAE